MLWPFDGGVSSVISALSWSTGTANRVATYFGFGANPQDTPPFGFFSSLKDYLCSVIVRLLHVVMYLVYGVYYSITYVVIRSTTFELPQLMADFDRTSLAKPTSTTYSLMVRAVKQQITEISPKAMLYYALAMAMTLAVFAMWKIEKLAQKRGNQLELYESEMNDKNEEESIGQSENWHMSEFSDFEIDSDGMNLGNVDQIESELEEVGDEWEEDKGEPKEETENKSKSRKIETRSKLRTPLAVSFKNHCADYKNWFLDSQIDLPGPSDPNEPPKKHLKNLKPIN